MKINYYFRSILTSFILLAALSCNKSDEIEEPTPDEPQSQGFEVAISGDLNSSLVADIKVDNYDSIYVVGMVSEDVYESEMNSSAEDYAYYLIDFIQASGSQLDRADNEYTFKGDSQSDLKSTWEPAFDTKYYIAVFGVNTEGVVSTEIVMKEYTTQAAPVSPFTVSVIGSDVSDIALEVNVSDDYEGDYIVGPVTKEFFEKSLDSKVSLLAGIVLSYVSDQTDGSYDVSTGYAYNGSQTIDLDEKWDFEPNTEYIIAVFGLRDYDDGTGLGTIVVPDEPTTQTAEFTTSDVVAPVGLVDVATYGEPDEFGFSVEVTKSEEVDYYYIAVISDSEYNTQYDSDAAAAARGYIDVLYSGVVIDDFSQLIGSAPVFNESGVVDLHPYYKYALNPATDYTVLAFGVDESFNITSSVGVCHQATADIERYDATFDIEVVGEATAENFIVNVSPSADNFNYLVCAYEKRAFDPLDGWLLDFNTLAPDYVKAAEIWVDDLSGWYEPVGEGEDPVLIDISVANGKTVFNGDASAIDIGYARTTALKASTEYVVLAFGISSNGTIVTDISTFDVETAAPEQSAVSFKFEVVKEMSYSDAMGHNGTVKIIPSDPNLKFFASIAVAANVDGLTDQEIFDANRFSMIAPYMSYTGEYLYDYNYVYEDSYIVVFGYEGGMTTPISKFALTVSE